MSETGQAEFFKVLSLILVILFLLTWMCKDIDLNRMSSERPAFVLNEEITKH